MKTVDMPKEFTKFTPSDQFYIKKFEQLNAGRASDMKLMRSRNKRAALLLGGAVIGICIFQRVCKNSSFVHKSALRTRAAC